MSFDSLPIVSSFVFARNVLHILRRWASIVPLACLFAVLWCVGTIHAQPIMVGFQRYTSEQGLSQNSGICFLQDRQGFIWVGTQNGLNRLNGYTIDVFKSEQQPFIATPQDKSQQQYGDTPTLHAIGTNWITHSYQDKAGRLWFGGENSISMYAPQSVRDMPVRRHNFIAYAPDTRFAFSGGNITAICDDKTGALWVGTNRGLNIFHTADSTFFILKAEGNTFGAQNGGMNSPQNRQARAPMSGLRGNLITAICRDSTGTMWIGTDNGVFLYRESGDAFVEVETVTDVAVKQKEQDQSIARAVLKRQDVGGGLAGVITTYECQAMMCDERGVVWIATRHGVIAYKSGGQRLCEYMPANALPVSLQKNNTIRSIQSTQDAVWFFFNFGTVRLDRATAMYDVFLAGDAQHHRTSNATTSGLVDRHGNLWVGTYSGLYTWNTLQSAIGNDAKSRTHIMEKSFYSSTESEALSDSFVYSLYEDRTGAVWVGTNVGGICVYQTHRRQMGLLRHSPTQKDKLSYPSVRSFLDIGDGMIWIGTDNGLDIYNSATGKVVQSRTANDFGLAHIDAFNVWALAQSGKRVFMGLSGALVIHDRAVPASKTLYAEPSNPRALTDGRVTALLPAQGTRMGKVWVATGNFTTRDNTPGVQGGLNLVDPVSAHVERWWNPLADATDKKNVQAEDYILRSLCYDPDNANGLWVGTMNGLYRFNPDNPTRITAVYRADTRTPNALRSDNINCVFVDSKKRLWVGTPMGLHHLITQSQTFEHIGKEQGLLDEWIYSIQEDSTGNLWLSTNAGLVCYHHDTRFLQHFTHGSGVQGNEYNTGAFGTVRTGSMTGALMFGGVSGANIFYPRVLLESVQDIVPVFCGLFINQSEYVLDSVVVHHLVLPHDKNFIKVEFSAFDFNLLKAIRYQYHLDGVDQDWQDVTMGEIPFAVYTSLSPGEYVLRVRAMRRDGKWSAHHATMRISIMAPWWRTRWAIALYIIGGIGGILGIVQYNVWRLRRERELRRHAVDIRTAEIQRQNAQLEIQKIQLENQNNELNRVLEESKRTNEALQQINREKNEIMGIVAHDLKNPLSGIGLTAENLMLRAERNQDDKTKQLAERINTATERMVEIISRLLNVNQLEAGVFTFRPALHNVGDIIRNLVRQHEEQAKRKHIQIFTSIPDIDLAVFTDREALLQILENLFSNALKFTAFGKNVYIRTDVRTDVAMSAQFVMIAIQDEGPGITADEQLQLFQKFRRLSAQPTGGESSTGLGLSIVKRFADSIGARIVCESIVGMGTTFTVVLPIASGIVSDETAS